jgi:hypothetical protein
VDSFFVKLDTLVHRNFRTFHRKQPLTRAWYGQFNQWGDDYGASSLEKNETMIGNIKRKWCSRCVNLCRLGYWLRNWRISINFSESTVMLFTKKRIQRSRPIQFLGETIASVETARYLAVTFDTRFTWSAHISQVGRKASQRLGVLGPLLNRSGLSIRNGVLTVQAAHPSYDGLRMSDLEVRCP